MRSTSNSIVPLLLLCGYIHVTLCPLIECQKQDVPSSEPDHYNNYYGSSDKTSRERQPQARVDLGLFTYDIYYNETNFKDKLRVSKSYFKTVLNDKLRGSSLIEMKMSRLEELVRCDNLTLLRASLEPSIDCRPIEEHILEGVEAGGAQSRPGSLDNNYVKRSSIRWKRKASFFKRSTKTDLLLYPLRQETIDEKIATTLEEINTTNEGLGFGSNEARYGQYFETGSSPSDADEEQLNLLNIGELFNIRCSGLVLFAVNGTSVRNPEDESSHFYDFIGAKIPQFIVDGVIIADTAYDNGFLLSIRDVVCRLDLPILPISLVNNFSIIRRLEFPFVHCKHTMAMEGLTSLWKYEGSIKQTRSADSVSADAYNTTIGMTSLSGVVDVLNFQLDQTFAHLDANTGFEFMTFVHPYLSAIVQGDWTVDSLVKSLKLFAMDATKKVFARNLDDGSIQPFAIVSYNNQSDDDYVGLTFKISKKYMFSSSEPIDSQKKDYTMHSSKVEL